ncbi:hypothetical protein ACWEQL_18845 [Kitasatospora sp. NPDC004240]
MASHRRLRLLPAAVLAVASVTLSACGDDGPAASAPPPALGPVATVTDPAQITLPTDGYLATVAQVRQIVQAQDAVTAACMRDFGFTARPTVLVGLDDAPRRRLTHSPLYGYFDTAGRQAKGYDNLAASPDQTAPGTRNTPPSADEQTALTGSRPVEGQPAGKVNGRDVPEGGCLKVGRDKVGETPVIDEAALPEGGPKVPVNDPRVVEAHAKWSACMKGKGFGYQDPVQANLDARWRQPSEVPTASPEQVAAATADVDCKLAGNTVGVIVAVQSAYGSRYVEANAGKLAAYRQQLDEQVRKAAALVSGG